MAVSHANSKSNLAVANERSAKVSYAKQHAQCFNISLTPLRTTTTTTTTTSKIWPLARGFLPYKRERKDHKSHQS